MFRRTNLLALGRSYIGFFYKKKSLISKHFVEDIVSYVIKKAHPSWACRILSWQCSRRRRPATQSAVCTWKGSITKYIYTTYVPQCLSPCWNWEPPQPLSPQRVCTPSPTKGGVGAHSPVYEGVPIRTTGEKAKHSVYDYILCGFNHHSCSLNSTSIFFSSLNDNWQVQDNKFERRRGKESFIHDKNYMATLLVPESKGSQTWRKLQERINGYVVFKWNIRSWETGCCWLN